MGLLVIKLYYFDNTDIVKLRRRSYFCILPILLYSETKVPKKKKERKKERNEKEKVRHVFTYIFKIEEIK